MKRFTLPELHRDKKKLLAWLSYDGVPPTVYVQTAVSTLRWSHNQGSNAEEKPVFDEETLGIWWNEHRRALSVEFAKSAFNQHKPQTRTQWIAECLKSIGIKGFGTVAQRVQRAIAFRPDLYKDAKTVKVEEEVEAARIKALRAQMTAAVKAAEDAQANAHADLMQATNDASNTAT